MWDHCAVGVCIATVWGYGSWWLVRFTIGVAEIIMGGMLAFRTGLFSFLHHPGCLHAMRLDHAIIVAECINTAVLLNHPMDRHGSVHAVKVAVGVLGKNDVT